MGYSIADIALFIDIIAVLIVFLLIFILPFKYTKDLIFLDYLLGAVGILILKM